MPIHIPVTHSPSSLRGYASMLEDFANTLRQLATDLEEASIETVEIVNDVGVSLARQKLSKFVTAAQAAVWDERFQRAANSPERKARAAAHQKVMNEMKESILSEIKQQKGKPAKPTKPSSRQKRRV